jgi:hypothetical protein
VRWLSGPFVGAHLRVHRDSALLRSYLLLLIQELDAHRVDSLSAFSERHPPFAVRWYRPGVQRSGGAAGVEVNRWVMRLAVTL